MWGTPAADTPLHFSSMESEGVKTTALRTHSLVNEAAPCADVWLCASFFSSLLRSWATVCGGDRCLRTLTRLLQGARRQSRWKLIPLHAWPAWRMYDIDKYQHNYH